MSKYQLFNEIRGFFQHYHSVYKTDSIMRLYNKEKFDKIIRKLPHYKSYKTVKINEFGFLFYVIGQENNQYIDKFLRTIKYKEQVLADIDNPNFLTPLGFSVLNNLRETSRVLMDNGASLFQQGKDGNTLLHNACYYGKQDSIRYCLEHKMDLNAQNNFGDTPLHIAIDQEHIDVVKLLLEHKPNLLLANNGKLYPADEAIYTGKIKCAEHA